MSREKEKDMTRFEAIEALRGYHSAEAENFKQELFCSTEWFVPMDIRQQGIFDTITGRLF